MGTFLGHVMEGLCLFLLGLWWMYSVARRYYTTLNFHSSTWFPSSRYPNYAIEPFVSCTLFTVLSIIEVISGFDDGYYDWTNMQHTMLYSMYVVLSVTQLLQWYKNWVPAGVDYIFLLFLSLSFVFQMTFHTHDRPPVDVMLHKQLVIAAASVFFSVLLEFLNRDLVAAAVARALCMTLFGLHFVVIGFIIFPPWNTQNTIDLKSHAAMTKANVIFAFEICFCSVLVLFMFGITSALFSKDTVCINRNMNGNVWIRSKDVTHDKLENGQEGKYCSASIQNSAEQPSRFLRNYVHAQ